MICSLEDYVMPSHRRLIFWCYSTVALILAGCAASSHPQAYNGPSGARAECAPVASDAPAALRSKPGYEQVGVVVRDAAGHERRDLSKADFIVTRSGAPLEVQFAKWESDSPASVLILADTSGSTEPKLPQTRQAVTDIVNALEPSDDVALFAFSGRPFDLQPFTDDHPVIITKEQMFHSYGSTSLYDSAIVAGAMLATEGCYATRVLVVISDGIDNTSARSLDDTVRELANDGVSVYAIAIGTLTLTKLPPMRWVPLGS